MARKPNYVSITLVCGRCRGTIYFPSDCTKGIIFNLKRLNQIALGGDIISTITHLGNLASLNEIVEKMEFIYGEE